MERRQFFCEILETAHDFGLGGVVTIPADELRAVVLELKRCLFAAERATPVGERCVLVLNDLILELERLEGAR